MKRVLNFFKRHAATVFGLFAAVATAAPVYQLFCTCTGAFNIPSAAYCFVESLVVLLPYWWFRGRWRASAVVIAWIVSLFSLANILYFRYWGFLMPFQLVGQAGNANGVLMESALGVVRVPDIVFLIAPAAVTALWCVPSVRRAVCAQRMRLPLKIIATILTLLLYASVQCKYTARWYSMVNRKHLEFRDIPALVEDKFIENYDYYRSSHLPFFQNSGFNAHVFIEMLDVLDTGLIGKLTEGERDSLERYVSLNDSTTVYANNGKNLIFVLVESLDADIPFLKVNGREITPVLNSLIEREGTLSALNVATQIGLGNSADGQYLYNLGLLPDRKKVAGCDYVPFINNLPAVPRLLPDDYRSTAVFADYGSGWRKKDSYAAYGYDSIFTRHDIEKAVNCKGISRDGVMFSYALAKAKQMPQPFYMQLLTIQMHLPCTENVVDAADYAGTGLTRERQRYLNCTANFDRHLGKFIKGLKDCGLWENTVLVIASDHNLPDTRKPDGSRGDIVFIAANCGITERIDTPVAQVDVFPTVLDIMGVDSKWRGVGRSMLGPRRGEGDARQQSVSDSIIRSDFFR